MECPIAFQLPYVSVDLRPYKTHYLASALRIATNSSPALEEDARIVLETLRDLRMQDVGYIFNVIIEKYINASIYSPNTTECYKIMLSNNEHNLRCVSRNAQAEIEEAVNDCYDDFTLDSSGDELTVGDVLSSIYIHIFKSGCNSCLPSDSALEYMRLYIEKLIADVDSSKDGIASLQNGIVTYRGPSDD